MKILQALVHSLLNKFLKNKLTLIDKLFYNSNYQHVIIMLNKVFLIMLLTALFVGCNISTTKDNASAWQKLNESVEDLVPNTTINVPLEDLPLEIRNALDEVSLMSRDTVFTQRYIELVLYSNSVKNDETFDPNNELNDSETLNSSIESRHAENFVHYHNSTSSYNEGTHGWSYLHGESFCDPPFTFLFNSHEYVSTQIVVDGDIYYIREYLNEIRKCSHYGQSINWDPNYRTCTKKSIKPYYKDYPYKWLYGR